jgi:hypothetical protein
MAKPYMQAQGRRTTRCVCSAWRRGWVSARCTVTAGPSLLSSSIVLTFEQDCCYMAKPCTHAQDHTLRVFRLEEGLGVYTLHGHCGPITTLFIDITKL